MNNILLSIFAIFSLNVAAGDSSVDLVSYADQLHNPKESSFEEIFDISDKAEKSLAKKNKKEMLFEENDKDLPKKEAFLEASAVSEDDMLLKQVNAKQTNLKRIFVPVIQRKDKINDSSEVLRDDKEKLTYNVSINDVITTEVCFGAPVRILLGPSITHSLFSATTDDVVGFKALVMEDKRSGIIALAQPVIGNKVLRTRLRLVRDTDFKSYIVNVTGVDCNLKSKFELPAEIILENKPLIKSANDSIMPAEDTIIENTSGYKRKNQTNLIQIYSGAMAAASDWLSLGVSVKLGDSVKKQRKLEFVVFDSLQNSVIASSAQYLEKSSVVATRINKHPTLRINLKVNVSKKYILERGTVYIAMMDHDGRYYQYAKVDLKNLYKRLKRQGYDLN
jgi:hypothetical protein